MISTCTSFQFPCFPRCDFKIETQFCLVFEQDHSLHGFVDRHILGSPGGQCPPEVQPARGGHTGRTGTAQCLEPLQHASEDGDAAFAFSRRHRAVSNVGYFPSRKPRRQRRLTHTFLLLLRILRHCGISKAEPFVPLEPKSRR